jgi:tetratricopeptide (TPR) repeat protein
VAVARTIQICNFALIVSSLAFGQAVAARAPDRSALGSYIQARIADVAGNSDAAVAAYSAAMTSAPGNDLVALRAYREAVDAGDRVLAMRAVRQLQQRNALPADARLLAFIDGIQRADWKSANVMLDRIEEQGGYDFLVPILRAWTVFGARSGDPIAILNAPPRGSLATSYTGEHRALMLLATGNRADGLAASRALSGTDTRMIAARIAAAAKLAEMKDKDAALGLLGGDDATLALAKAQLSAGRPLGGMIDTPLRGTAALLARVAADLMRDRVSPVALTLARLARFADPKSEQIALIEAQALDANRRDEAALLAYRAVPTSSVYAADVRDGLVGVLQRVNKADEAILLAKATVTGKGATLIDHVRLGEIFMRTDRYAEAAAAFDTGVNFAKGADGKGSVPWGLWLVYGGALEKAGDWAGARTALRNAVELAPEQAGALNQLGYSMLERREDVEEAAKLIAKASALRPDDASITDSLGWAYFIRGDAARAIPLLERAVVIDGIEPTLSEHLGDAYWSVGRKVEARYAWRAALLHVDKDAHRNRLVKKIDFGLTADTASR